MKWILYRSEDGTERCFAPEPSFSKCPSLKLDLGEKPMTREWECEADSFEQAIEMKNAFLGWAEAGGRQND